MIEAGECDRGPGPICKYCHQWPNMESAWHLHNGKWRLFYDGVLHTCHAWRKAHDANS
jgi:hypothetical protein